MASINVKIPTLAVLDSLKAKAEQIRNDKARYDLVCETYDRDIAKYCESVKSHVHELISDFMEDTLAPCNVTVDVQDVWNQADVRKVVIEVLVPTTSVPQRDSVQRYNDYNNLAELDSAIRLLTMTTDTTVNASTFKAVSRFI